MKKAVSFLMALVLALGLIFMPCHAHSATVSQVNAAVTRVVGPTLVKVDGSWYYARNGRVDFTATTLVSYNGSWYYVRNGKVDFSATTLVSYNGSWYYVRNGKVNFSATTLVSYNGSWYYVRNGKVDFSATTLVKYNGRWYYVHNGRVDFTAHTLVHYNGSRFLVKNGTTQPNVTTLYQLNGTWYYLVNGKVSNANTVINYNGKDYKVENGIARPIEESATDSTATAFEQEVIRLVNEIRQANGLGTLTYHEKLGELARYKSQDMADKEYFDHISPTYGSPFEMMESFGVAYNSAGENIAYGFTTAEAVVDGWMNSPGHRANILNSSYTHIGVGYWEDGCYWTQMFIGIL